MTKALWTLEDAATTCERVIGQYQVASLAYWRRDAETANQLREECESMLREIARRLRSGGR